MKKVLAMILAAAMVLALCACGSTAAPAATEAPAQEAQTNEQPAAEKTEAELLDECEPVVITLGRSSRQGRRGNDRGNRRALRRKDHL